MFEDKIDYNCIYSESDFKLRPPSAFAVLWSTDLTPLAFMDNLLEREVPRAFIVTTALCYRKHLTPNTHLQSKLHTQVAIHINGMVCNFSMVTQPVLHV